MALSRFCCILNAVSIDLTWILTILGIIVGGASIPIALVLTWSRMSTVATIVAPWVGLASGLTAWLVVTSLRSGSITVHSTGNPINAVAGNIASLITGLLVAVALSFIFSSKYSSSDPAAIDRANKIQGLVLNGSTQPSKGSDIENGAPENNATTANDSEKTTKPQDETITPVSSTGNELVNYLNSSYIEPMDPVAVRKATRLVVCFNAVYILIAVLLVPYTLFGSSWIFSRAGFRGWCVVSFIWVWFTFGVCVLWPLFESRETIGRISKGLIRG